MIGPGKPQLKVIWGQYWKEVRELAVDVWEMSIPNGRKVSTKAWSGGMPDVLEEQWRGQCDLKWCYQGGRRGAGVIGVEVREAITVYSLVVHCRDFCFNTDWDGKPLEVLNRKVMWSDLHVNRIILDTILRVD